MAESILPINRELKICGQFLRLNRDIDVENKCMNTKGERGRVGGIGRLRLTHTLLILCIK